MIKEKGLNMKKLLKKISSSYQEYKELKIHKNNIKKYDTLLVPVIDNTEKIKNEYIISIAPLYNEAHRLKRYIEHNKSIGIDHMIFIDNNSSDNPVEIIKNYDFCSIFFTTSSYAKARSGVYWINYLVHKYALHHWCIFADIDEHFIFPYCDSRDIHELVEFFERNNKYSVCSTMVDLYKSPFDDDFYFDSSGYFYFEKDCRMYVRGGPRVRIYNSNFPAESPTNVKYPLIKIDKNVYYRSSSHTLFPSHYCTCHFKNKIFPTGVIAHYKFDESFSQKINEALERQQHFGGSIEYKEYAKQQSADLFNSSSMKFVNWESFVDAGLMTCGQWF